MFGSIRRAFGMIKVTESSTDIIVEGVPAEVLARDISKIWNSSHINANMFSRISRNGFSFPKFFALEIHYMLGQVDEYRYARSSLVTLRNIQRLLETNTWMKSITEEHPPRLDLNLINDLTIKLMPHQEGFLQHYSKVVSEYGLKGYLLSADPGTGKAQPLDAPIRVPGGWSTMGEMTVGTKVIAKDGSVTSVTGVYPQGEKLIYRVTFTDGRTTECCGEHLWKVRWHGRGDAQSLRVMDTLTIAEQLKRGDQRFHIQLIDPEERPEVHTPIDPYALGVLIGDGHLCHGNVRVSMPDQFIINELTKTLPDDLTIKFIHRYDYRIKAKDGYSNSYLKTIRALGLAEKLSVDKFIPSDYLNGSISQRLALLQGLMDTDGTADKGGCASYSTSSEHLARDVQQLVWSLGGIAYITSRIPHFTYKGERFEGKLAYRVFIRYRKPSNLFRLPRKQQYARDDGQYNTTLMLKITSIEPVGEKAAQCISIAHADRLYVTGDYIVTHNTFMGLALSHLAKSDITVIVSPKNALDSVWVDSIKKIFKKPVKWWKANSGIPYAGEPYIISNYEAIPKALDAARHHTHSHACVILDESHNLNEAKSNRTQGFLELCKELDAKNVLWSSGSPLKALGYEMVPLLRSIDPLFTTEVEQRFVKIFGKETGRALDILRNRIGKISFHVAASAVVQNTTSNTDLKITLENGHEFTIDAVRAKIKAYMEERLEYYRSHFKQYRDDFEAGVAAYRRVMPEDQAKPLDKYIKAVNTISKGFDPVAHKELSLYINYFEKKVLIPGIPDKAIRDAFKNARSVVKYYPLRAMGEALGNVLGKARIQCHLEMIKRVDWRAIIDGSEKKVLVFSSYVDVVKAVDVQLKSLGYDGIVVMGETNKNVAPLIKELETNNKLRYCVATYASLSTAVPVTMCNTEVLTNVPWRSFELKQAKARIDRLGQNGPVHFFYLILDTGNEPNISTRSHEILEWSREMVQKLMGTDHLEPGMARVLNNDFLTNTNEQCTIGLESDNAFQLVFDEMLGK